MILRKNRRRGMIEVAPDVWQIPLLPFDLLNVFLLGDVLVDAGPTFASGKLIRLLNGVNLSAIVLTHAHFDHQGACKNLCEQFGIPLFCGQGDRFAVEEGIFLPLMPDPSSFIARLNQLLAGPAYPVNSVLREGEMVSGFRVIETPGHTPGHISLWRENDRVLIVGDTLFNRSPLSLILGLQRMFRSATYSREQNRESARRLMKLKPDVVCFGHGPPLNDPSKFNILDAFLN